MKESWDRILRVVTWSVMTAALAVALAACDSSRGGGGSGKASHALWVPNFDGLSITEFAPNQLKKSGTTTPHASNASANLDNPEQAVFDHSNNLWVTNCADPQSLDGSVVEFTSGALKKLGHNQAPTAKVVLTDDGRGDIFRCPYGAQFDESGNLWVVNRQNANLISFTPDQLKLTGVVFPDTEIDPLEFTAPEGIAFDQAGTLWIADLVAGEIFGYKAATLASVAGQTTSTSPDIINSATTKGTNAVAFDSNGNLWVTNCFDSSVEEFAVADLAVSGNPTPLVVLNSTAVSTPDGATLSLDCPDGLTFDKHDNLWVANALSNSQGSIAEFSSSQLTASGNPAPVVFIDSNKSATNLNEPVLLTFGPSL